MWYAIMCEDVADSLQKRMSVRPAHVERLNALKREGRLLLAGPLPAVDAEDPGTAGFTGSLIVAQFTSLQEAQDWTAADPYATAGVFARVSVKPFRKTLP
jgi:uncharacterized protein